MFLCLWRDRTLRQWVHAAKAAYLVADRKPRGETGGVRSSNSVGPCSFGDARAESISLLLQVADQIVFSDIGRPLLSVG